MEHEQAFAVREPVWPDPFNPATWPEEDEGVAGDLDVREPGILSHAAMASVDPAELSGDELVTLLRAQERLVAHVQALQAQVIARLAADTHDWESVSAEIACALHLSRRAADGRLAQAVALWTRHPTVGGALLGGNLDWYRAKVICEGVEDLPDEAAHSIVDTVLERASDLTAGQLRAWIRRLRLTLDPDDAHHRYDQTFRRRRVVTMANPDGTADLYALDVAPDRVAEARDRIERIARSLKTGDETRTLDQLRADVLIDLLCGTRHDDAARGVVDITVELDTLANLADHPGELPGWGPVIADIVRRLAFEHGRTWQVTLTQEGRSVWSGTTRRRPDTATARQVRTRDRRCVFPGCRMPARACDLDHTTAWKDGGPTTVANLAPLCRHHHRLRDHGWAYERLPDGGYRWTSPLGRHYTSRPPP